MNMKNLTAFAACLVVFGCSPLSGPDKSVNSQYSIHLTGRILNMDGSPMVNTVVKLKSRCLSDITDAAGCYCISEKKGDHKLPDQCRDTLEYCKDSQTITKKSIPDWIDTLPDVYTVQRDIYGGLTSVPQSFGKITATITDVDSIHEVAALWYNVANKCYSGFFYSVYSAESVNYSVYVSVYNTAGVLTGRSVTVTFPSKTAGDINMPAFDPNNACAGHDTTVDTTTPLALPGAVILTVPADNATGVSVTPALLWNAGPGGTPSKYFVKVSTSHSFSANVVNDTTTSTLDMVGTTLSNLTRYYWEVAANNAAGTSAYTIDSFTTIAAPVYPPCTYPADPHTPMMLNKDSTTVALWNFNQLSGSTVPDESGTGNNGSMFGTTQLITADWGTGIQLAAGCGVKVLDATTLRLSNFEITAHVYPTQFGSYNNIVAKEPPGSGAPGGYILRFDGNGYISGYIKYWDWVGVHTQCPAQLNTWYLIRLVKTATTFSLYVNNILVSSINTTIDPSVEVGDLAIGYDVNLVEDRTFRGYIDAIKINKL